jgi:hypothetical protein
MTAPSIAAVTSSKAAASTRAGDRQARRCAIENATVRGKGVGQTASRVAINTPPAPLPETNDL